MLFIPVTLAISTSRRGSLPLAIALSGLGCFRRAVFVEPKLRVAFVMLSWQGGLERYLRSVFLLFDLGIPPPSIGYSREVSWLCAMESRTMKLRMCAAILGCCHITMVGLHNVEIIGRFFDASRLH